MPRQWLRHARVCPLVENVLVEDKSDSLHLNPQAADHGVAAAQRRLVIDFHTVEHWDNAALLHLFKRKSGMAAKSVARVFEVVQVVGVIDYALAVEFIVAHLHFK